MVKAKRPPPVDIQDIINAFNNSITASINTILQIDPLNDSSPRDFILRYCTSPLESLRIELIDAEIRKEVELYFFSLTERQHEFIPISLMRDLYGSRRFQITITGKSVPFEFKVMFLYSRDNSSVTLDDIRLDEIKAIDRVTNFMTSVKRFEPFTRTVIQISVATIVSEGLKKLLGG